jgi:hypothetical protein
MDIERAKAIVSVAQVLVDSARAENEYIRLTDSAGSGFITEAKPTDEPPDQLRIDREGEFATLRERFPYVLAGREGDVPADVRTAKLLVRRIVELGTSIVATSAISGSTTSGSG